MPPELTLTMPAETISLAARAKIKQLRLRLGLIHYVSGDCPEKIFAGRR
jgi:hypothetical protein